MKQHVIYVLQDVGRGGNRTTLPPLSRDHSSKCERDSDKEGNKEIKDTENIWRYNKYGPTNTYKYQQERGNGI